MTSIVPASLTVTVIVIRAVTAHVMAVGLILMFTFPPTWRLFFRQLCLYFITTVSLFYCLNSVLKLLLLFTKFIWFSSFKYTTGTFVIGLYHTDGNFL